ncbi:MarR family transcriptional regulator [Alteriqipengyuania sp.]|uniref:MarR family transcriptional regulator n=1 Tax=Alteriqipengyuania sp. TaxID=2800692 RepID=UPI003517600A
MLQAECAVDRPSYEPVSDAAGLPVAISLFADRTYLRTQMLDDAGLAGFRVVQAEPLAAMEDGTARVLGDIVMVDAPAADAPTLAMLERLAQRIARSGGQLIVSTRIGALEPVMVAASACEPALLVEPGRSERLVAFGEALARIAGRRVRELSEDDRVMVLRLVERVSALAERLDGLTGDSVPADGASAFAFGTGTPASGSLREHLPDQSGDEHPHKDHRHEEEPPPLPDPRRVRAVIRKRQLRARFFDASLFADPAWDILLDLTAAHAEGRRVSVTSLCIASGVPPTTALRWISQMTQQGLLRREDDQVDRRRAFVALSDTALSAMSRYFEAAGSPIGAGV